MWFSCLYSACCAVGIAYYKTGVILLAPLLHDVLTTACVVGLVLLSSAFCIMVLSDHLQFDCHESCLQLPTH